MQNINFRKAWELFKDKTSFVSQNKELELIYRVKEVQGLAFKSGYNIIDEWKINKAMLSLERKGDKLTLSKILIHKTEF